MPIAHHVDRDGRVAIAVGHGARIIDLEKPRQTARRVRLSISRSTVSKLFSQNFSPAEERTDRRAHHAQTISSD